MDERTLQTSLRARPPTDPAYRAGLDASVPGQRVRDAVDGPRLRSRTVTPLVAMLVGLLALTLGATYLAGAAPAPSPSPPPGPADLVGIPWRLASVTPSGGISKQEILEDQEIELTFGADGTLSGSVDCARYAGSYRIDGSTVGLAPKATLDPSPSATPAAPRCEHADVIPDLWFQMLEMLDRWAVSAGRLTLSSSGGTAAALFRPSVAMPSESPSVTPFAMSGFRAPFTVDAGLMGTTWHEHVDRPDWVYLGWRDATNEDDEGITFLYLDDLAVAPACGGSRHVAPWDPFMGPATFHRWLGQAGPITVGPAWDVTIGGRDGLEFDVTSEGLAACGGFLYVTQTEPDNGFGFLAGHVSRVTAFDVDGGGTVLIVVDDADPARFPDLAADADELLATLAFD